MHAGRLAALGTTGELKEMFGDRVIVEVHAGNPVEAMRLLDAMPEVEKTSVFGTAVHAVLKGDRDRGTAAIAERLERSGVRLAGIAPVQPSLEDVFLEVVEQAG
jgi:ABC-type multidrug transport system ATPase subunit